MAEVRVVVIVEYSLAVEDSLAVEEVPAVVVVVEVFNTYKYIF